MGEEEEMGLGIRELREAGWTGSVELTALHLVAHVATVVPAVTLSVFGDAHARVAGELIWAGCVKREKMKERGGDAVGEGQE